MIVRLLKEHMLFPKCNDIYNLYDLLRDDAKIEVVNTRFSGFYDIICNVYRAELNGDYATMLRLMMWKFMFEPNFKKKGELYDLYEKYLNKKLLNLEDFMPTMYDEYINECARSADYSLIYLMSKIFGSRDDIYLDEYKRILDLEIVMYVELLNIDIY